MTDDATTIGGIVLAGGRSRRMGRSKAMLPFGPERMLQRVVRVVGCVVEPLVVVAAEGQELPELPGEVAIVRDRHADLGPLEGLAAGFGALSGRAGAAFVTACDVPLVTPDYVRRMVELSAGYAATVPHVAGFDEPLSAVYRTDVLKEIEALLAAGRFRPAFLFDRVRTRRVSEEELTDVDPELQSLANVNTPADYRAALARAGFDVPGDSGEEPFRW
jgi:molybdopterin-guanine dinucleotide biosynthesis protein A